MCLTIPMSTLHFCPSNKWIKSQKSEMHFGNSLKGLQKFSKAAASRQSSWKHSTDFLSVPFWEKRMQISNACSHPGCSNTAVIISTDKLLISTCDSILQKSCTFSSLISMRAEKGFNSDALDRSVVSDT